MTKQKKLLLEPFVNNRYDYPYGKLSRASKVVIGCRLGTDLSDEKIAHLLGCTVSQFLRFEKKLMRSKECRYVMGSGLPASFGVSVCEKVICKKCGKYVSHIPCVSCCGYGSDWYEDKHEEDLPECSVGTNVLAGSLEKVAVMAARVEMGMQPFSKEDDPGADEGILDDDFIHQFSKHVERCWYDPFDTD